MYNIVVFGDGIWRRRGFFFFYGVVIVFFIVIGKVLDCEVMFKECRMCMFWRGKERFREF